MANSQELEQIFNNMADNFDASKAGGVNATIQFDLSGDNGGLYWLKLADGSAEAGSGQAESPNMTLKAAADDWLAVTKGELNPMQAFMSGKLKVQGDMSLALKLQSLLS